MAVIKKGIRVASNSGSRQLKKLPVTALRLRGIYPGQSRTKVVFGTGSGRRQATVFIGETVYSSALTTTPNARLLTDEEMSRWEGTSGKKHLDKGAGKKVKADTGKN
jgi:hypothetical protein